MFSPFARFCFIAFCWLGLISSLLGDGMKVPQQGVRAYPDIPYQEAFIAHRDGVETLIIQSSIDGEGETFGWVVPVPAAPTHFEVVSPGVFGVLKQAVEPQITMESDLGGYVAMTLLLVFLGAVIICPKAKRGRLSEWLLFLLILLLLAAMAVPSFQKVRSTRGAIPGVEVEQAARIGNYDVVVLRGESSEPLNQWLAENGFQALPEVGDAIVTDYIKQEWRFVATKLRRESASGETLAPHPLRMDFPAETPVYPMRLTALNAGPEGMRLELFLAADGTPAAPIGMAIEESAAFRGPLPALRSRIDYWDDGERPKIFRNEARKQSIGLPDLLPVLWDGVQLTRLSGIFRPADIAKDIELEIGPAINQRAHYYSKKAAWQGALGFAVLLGAGVFFAFAMIERRRKTPYRESLKSCLGGFVGTSGVLFLVIYLWLPVVPVERLSSSPWLMRHSMRERVAIAQLELGEVDAPLTNENIVSHFKRLMRSHYGPNKDNLPWRQPPIEEASPGNYVVLEEGGETVIRFFDYDGAPIDIRASDFEQ